MNIRVNYFHNLICKQFYLIAAVTEARKEIWIISIDIHYIYQTVRIRNQQNCQIKVKSRYFEKLRFGHKYPRYVALRIKQRCYILASKLCSSLEFNGTYKFVAYADVNLLAENIRTTKKKSEIYQILSGKLN
jgi:hypothetical protein